MARIDCSAFYAGSIVLSWVVLGILGGGHTAQGAAQIGVSLPATIFDPTPPPAFQASQSLQVSNIFTSCSNYSVPLTSMMNNMMNNSAMNSSTGDQGGFTSMLGASCMISQGVSVNTVCPGSDLMNGSILQGMTDCNSFNPNMVQQLTMQLQNSLCTNECKDGKDQAIQGQLKCLTTQAELLSQQAGSLLQVYTQNIQKMQTDVVNIKSAEEDRKEQIQDVQNKISGNKESGTPGLLNLQADTQKLLSEMPTQIQAERAHYQKVVQLQTSLDEQIQIRRAALEMDCFQNRPVNTYKCDPNGPPVSPMAYLLCRYGQNQLLGSGGVLLRNDAVNKQSQASSNALQAVLSQIVADAPNITKMPTNAQEATDAAQQPLLVLTAADIESRYGAVLRQYAIGNTNADSFVMNIMASCETRATQTVNIEEQRNNTTIGQDEFNLRNEQQNTTQEITTLFNQYNQQYAQDMSGLSGQAVSLNTGACMNAPTATQLNCLQSFQTNVQGLLFGTSSTSTMQVQIQGNNPTTYVNFSCQGINGCIASMQNATRSLATSLKQDTQYEKQYELQAFQSTDAFTKQMASTMSVQSQLLTQQLQAINAGLASLGQGGINFPNVKGEALQKDENGLPKEPTNIVNLIGQYVNPPLLDLSNTGSSASALTGVAQAEQQIKQNNMQIIAAMVQVKNMPFTCQMQRNQQIIDRIGQSSAGAGGCWATSYCDPPEKIAGTLATMFSAAQSLTGLQGTYGSGAGALESLNTGISTFCEGRPIGQRGDQAFDSALGFASQNQSSCLNFFNSLVGAQKMLTQQGTMGSQAGKVSGVGN